MCDPKRLKAITKRDLVMDVTVVFASIKAARSIVVISTISYWVFRLIPLARLYIIMY